MRNTRIEELEKLLRSEPGDSFLQYALALEYQKEGDPEKAQKILEDLLIQNQEYLAAYYPLGQIYEDAGELSEAEEIYSRGMHLAEQRGDNHHKEFLMRALTSVQRMKT